MRARRTALTALLVVAGPMAASSGCGSCHDGPAVHGGGRPEVNHVETAPDASDASDASHADDTNADLPPLASAGEVVTLAVPGFGEAFVSLPAGARARRPVMVAVHGNYDRPDFHCGLWRTMVRDRGFILCPRGVPRRDSPGPDDIRFTYEGKFAAELDAALAALLERHGAWIDPGPMIYIGFSLGAILARGYVSRAPARFDRLILIEGGASGWDGRAAQKAGVQRMLWACGQATCADAARKAATALERAKVPSKVVYAKGEGHSYGGAVAEAIRDEWEWLVEGDPRWSSED